MTTRNLLNKYTSLRSNKFPKDESDLEMGSKLQVRVESSEWEQTLHTSNKMLTELSDTGNITHKKSIETQKNM